MAKAKKRIDAVEYKTEEQLKAEALARRAEQAKIDALKKPPPPRKVKADNFWYHYKWHTIAGAVALCIAVFFIKDTVFKTNPDTTIVLATSRYISVDTTELLQQALAEIAGDHNGDGKKYIAADNIYYSPDSSGIAEETAAEPTDGAQAMEYALSGGGESEYASVIKLTTVIVAGLDPIYLVDDALYDHLASMAADEEGIPHSLFEDLPDIPAAQGDRLPFSETVLSGLPGLEALEDLTFCIRPNQREKQREIAYYEYCRELLARLAG